MQTLQISTNQKDEVIDITSQIQRKVEEQILPEGVCHVFIAHTTCAVTTMDLDPGTDQDFLDALRNILPKNLHYRHPHDPSHAPDHILSSFIGPSVIIPFSAKKLLLGTWQRVVLVELDGPRMRNVVISFIS